MGKKFLSTGTMVSCTFGASPMPAIASRKSIKMDGLTVLTSKDKDFVKTFGVCMSTGVPKPCKPSLLTWVNFIPNLTYKGGKALTTDSFIFCNLGGKVSPLAGGQLRSRHEAEKIICPLCGKDHLKHKFVTYGGGCSVGDYSILGMNMQSPFKHEWGKKFNGNKIAAHHLIPQKLVNDANERNIWAGICYVYDYDINKKENGVYLPNKLPLACHLGVPLHFSNHGSGFGGYEYIAEERITVTYVNRIEQGLAEIENNYTIKDEPCPEEYKEGLIAAMDALSKKAFDNIELFNWTLTYDAINYKPNNPVGCGNKSTIKEKQDDIYAAREEVGGRYSEANGFVLTKRNVDHIREVRDAVLNNFLQPCSCGRIHEEYLSLGIQPNQKIKYGGTY